MKIQLEKNNKEPGSPPFEERLSSSDVLKTAIAAKKGNSNSQAKTSRIPPIVSFLTLITSIATTFTALQGMKLPWQEPGSTLLTMPSSTSAPAMAPTGSPTSKPKIADDSGALDAYGMNGQLLGQCPLKHTKVDAQVSGYLARVTVKQVFCNPFKDKIDARYRFPLSSSGAVDEMTMQTGGRLVKGEIKRREEAASIYRQARAQGYVASLLDQERTNVFTQSVANLEPGKEVTITIKYTEVLSFKDGNFEFVFPTVVGPRFNPYGARPDQPGSTGLSALMGSGVETNSIGAKSRSGHDISINVNIDEGMPIEKLTSPLHNIIAQKRGPNAAMVSLQQAATLPNRDFVLDIGVSSQLLKSGYLADGDANGGYLTVMVMPPKKTEPSSIAPRELIFLIDCSGSQAGAPIEKSKETLKYVIDHVNDNDTFQIVTFNSVVTTLFDKPEKLTLGRKMQAKLFVDKITAGGGTWMAPAVESVCSMPADGHRLRIVSFMTDGYVGNDYEIIGLVKKLRGTSRWFPFGIGDSVNRTLIDGIAREGGGESDVVLLNTPAPEVASNFYKNISSPVLTDVKLSTEGIQLRDVYPAAVSDVWSEKPLFFQARYVGSGSGTIYVNGFANGKPYKQALNLVLPPRVSAGTQVGQIWARAKIDDLKSRDWYGLQSGVMTEHLKEEIISTALKHHLMTEFTSFVAVDKMRLTSGNASASLDVPVEMPQGVGNENVTPAETANLQAAPSVVQINAGSGQGAPPLVSVNPIATQAASSSSDQYFPENPAAERVFGQSFRNVVNQLNSLSSAAASANGPPISPRCTTGSQVSFNVGDVVLAFLGFIPAPVRTGLIIACTVMAAFALQNHSRRLGGGEEVQKAHLICGILLLLFACALAIGHWNLIHYQMN